MSFYIARYTCYMCSSTVSKLTIRNGPLVNPFRHVTVDCRRNVHGVTTELIQRMIDRYEHKVTVQSILGASSALKEAEQRRKQHQQQQHQLTVLQHMAQQQQQSTQQQQQDGEQPQPKK